MDQFMLYRVAIAYLITNISFKFHESLTGKLNSENEQTDKFVTQKNLTDIIMLKIDLGKKLRYFMQTISIMRMAQNLNFSSSFLGKK
jgi:hypothetical protein